MVEIYIIDKIFVSNSFQFVFNIYLDREPNSLENVFVQLIIVRKNCDGGVYGPEEL